MLHRKPIETLIKNKLLLTLAQVDSKICHSMFWNCLMSFTVFGYCIPSNIHYYVLMYVESRLWLSCCNMNIHCTHLMREDLTRTKSKEWIWICRKSLSEKNFNWGRRCNFKSNIKQDKARLYDIFWPRHCFRFTRFFDRELYSQGPSSFFAIHSTLLKLLCHFALSAHILPFIS